MCAPGLGDLPLKFVTIGKLVVVHNMVQAHIVERGPHQGRIQSGQFCPREPVNRQLHWIGVGPAIGFKVHYLVAARVAEYRVDTSDHLLPGQGKRKRGFDGDRIALPEWTGSKFLGEVSQLGIITDIQLRTPGQVDRLKQFLCAVMRFNPRVEPGAETGRRDLGRARLRANAGSSSASALSWVADNVPGRRTTRRSASVSPDTTSSCASISASSALPCGSASSNWTSPGVEPSSCQARTSA